MLCTKSQIGLYTQIEAGIRTVHLSIARNAYSLLIATMVSEPDKPNKQNTPGEEVGVSIMSVALYAAQQASFPCHKAVAKYRKPEIR